MAGHLDLYRSLVRLYPRAFRHDYADDLVQNFADLIAHHGPSRTWRRTAVDLAVTVPRYRLETVMNPRHTNTTLYIATAIVATAAVGQHHHRRVPRRASSYWPSLLSSPLCPPADSPDRHDQPTHNADDTCWSPRPCWQRPASSPPRRSGSNWASPRTGTAASSSSTTPSSSPPRSAPSFASLSGSAPRAHRPTPVASPAPTEQRGAALMMSTWTWSATPIPDGEYVVLASVTHREAADRRGVWFAAHGSAASNSAPPTAWSASAFWRGRSASGTPRCRCGATRRPCRICHDRATSPVDARARPGRWGPRSSFAGRSREPTDTHHGATPSSASDQALTRARHSPRSGLGNQQNRNRVVSERVHRRGGGVG